MSGAALSLLAVLLLMPAVASSQNLQEPTGEQAMPITTEDPYENWNRRVFAFNDAVDTWFLRPIASAYRTVTPDFLDRGITNVFRNLGEIGNFANSLLQLKGESAVVAAGRFTFNTVFGLGGFFDVATSFDLPERPEDFGQTLAVWGSGSGPYLMLPLLGPATPRSFTGMVVDGIAWPSPWDEVENPEWYYLRFLQIVDIRADLIPAESFISGDRYTFFRNAFLQRREFMINDGKIINDPFSRGNGDDLMLEDF
jgi:phospholipid-binding lipoprotein MlaA